MIIGREKEQSFSAHRCEKPKFRDHRGRTWDSQWVILDGQRVDFIYDTSWGTSYFHPI